MRIAVLLGALFFSGSLFGQGTAELAITNMDLGVPGDVVSFEVQLTSSDSVTGFSFGVRLTDFYLEPISLTPMISAEGWYPNISYDGDSMQVAVPFAYVTVGCIVDLDLTTVEVLPAGSYSVARIDCLAHPHEVSGVYPGTCCYINYSNDFETEIQLVSVSLSGTPTVINEVVQGVNPANLTISDGLMAFSRGFKRGDTNEDGNLSISDVILLLYRTFGLEPAGDCSDAEDVNDDGVLDLSDSVALLDYLFAGGVLPAPQSCGHDLTPDGFDPCHSNSCP